MKKTKNFQKKTKIFQFQLIMKFLKENDINKKTYEIEFEGIPKEITSQTIKKL